MTPSTKPLPYTANPILLIINDLWLFGQITFTWPITAGLPSIIWPPTPTRSGSLDELAFTAANAWAIALHAFLGLAQFVFLVSLVPLAFTPLSVLYFSYIVAFVLGNQWFTILLNGWRKHGLLESNPKCIEGKAVHEHEKWVFINGVAVGSHWLQSNLDRLAMTFRRPVYGIHNQTRGIIFDVLECIIQRDLSYPTLDIRQAYSELVKILSDSDVHKLVLILHSQGAIEGGMVLDWLYTTVAAEQLQKLEIYTFGNAANHWNAPVISTLGDGGERGENGDNAKDRIVKHIEHYANTRDYVSRFGILHFRPDQAPASPPVSRTATSTSPGPASSSSTTTLVNGPIKSISVSSSGTRKRLKLTTSDPSTSAPALAAPSPKTPIERLNPSAQDDNRFVGRLFKRLGSGHQFNQHYLDNMFEMEGVDPHDLSKGYVKGGNPYMDMPVDMEVFDEWDTVQYATADVHGSVGNGDRPGSSIGQKERVKSVKELSRLWGYRNGMNPDEEGSKKQ
ncbi:uncharacterized protein Z518_08754 [Rhinocladiella mackenziei CBS 650.93]|uniref:Uncharacterized protein n=1 Tax=Rhinocladiella mackenziei CBS 650.93 TaxID=1442369 RepID=A0A0D2IHN2_9EURO|nr:uncharacterized protein Z518_08754 [Rhinocladiella mackenziei CBS 650.93]KIX02811.1 hypothetical protein Z518_08754 [Rhinocladiella mackenziei CBS 650.93]